MFNIIECIWQIYSAFEICYHKYCTGNIIDERESNSNITQKTVIE